MKISRIFPIVQVILSILLFQGPAFCQECMDCHTDADLVDEFPESMHGAGGILCEDCHADIVATEDGHEEASPVDCSTCHDDIGSVFKLSVHAEVWDGETIECKDCHGYHGIMNKNNPESMTYHLNISKICAGCHLDENRQNYTTEQMSSVNDYFDSIHGEGISQAGLFYAATCTDCHGTHKIRTIDDPASIVSRGNLPKTCAECHPGIYTQFVESVHGKDFLEGNLDVPVCNDCHESHRIYSHLDERSSIFATQVAATCSKCHDALPLEQKYHLPGMRQKTFMSSYHGAASRLGDTTVANCGSCHGYHDIKPSTDPTSSIHPDNLAITCGKCHLTDNPSDLTARGKIHLVTAGESHWITMVVKTFYVFAISGALFFFLFYITTDLNRYRRNKKARRK